MKHFIFLFHSLSFLVGFTAIILSIIAYIKYKSKIIKHYTYFIVALTTVLLEQTLSSYKLINVVDSFGLNIILNILSYLSAGFIIYFLPLLSHEFVEKEWTSRKRTSFEAAAFFPICSLIAYYLMPYNKVIVIFSSGILFLTILYCLVFLYLNLKNIKSDFIKGTLRVFLIITVLLFPYMYLDTRIEQISALSRLFPYGLLSVSIFYMIWSISSLYFGIKYFKYNLEKPYVDKDKKELREVLDAKKLFFEKFNITNREKEIILLLMKGYSYNQLAEELVISLTTVKTHVYNIYRKVEVKNKIELFNLINKEKL